MRSNDRSTPVFALIDCNNFFVSCERLFRPDLAGKPVVVLSSNDGCAVARSNEVKALGIPMGAPAFKYRDLFKRHNVVTFSANFELYGDISRRITDILTTITPRIEIYSIDESFLEIQNLPIEDYGSWGRMVRDYIQQWVGMPVSIGIAPSKTLAKLASERAKKDPELQGVLDLAGCSPSERMHHLGDTRVEDIWGIGWRLAPRVRGERIFTAAQFSQLRPKRAQQLMGIQGAQMVAELNGISCLPLQREGRRAKSISRGRTFGQDTRELGIVEAALASFTAQASYRLRRSGQLTRRVSIYLNTSKHKPNFRYWSREAVLPYPTADTGELIQVILRLFQEIYSNEYDYHRAGILLHDFVPASHLQQDLFGEATAALFDAQSSRMQAVDAINNQFGRGHIRYATELQGKAWTPKQRLRSPRYTTAWDELPTVY